MGDKFEWCGGEYDAADLKDALALLLASDTPQDQLLAQHYSDPWAPDSWKVLGEAAQSLLKDLAQSQTAYNTHVSLTRLQAHCMSGCTLDSVSAASVDMLYIVNSFV